MPADASGGIALKGEDGIRVTPDAPNSTLTLGLRPLLSTTGTIQACHGACESISPLDGTIIAEGALVSFHNVSLNALGPEGDAAIYAFEAGRSTGAFIRWWHAADSWQTSSSLDVQGRVTTAGPLTTLTPVSTGPDSPPLVVGTAAAQGVEDLVLLRGSAQLVNGAVTVRFPAIYSALIDGTGVTAQVTPTSRGDSLVVTERAFDHIKVETMSGAATNQTFDYFIQASRASDTPFKAVRTE